MLLGKNRFAACISALVIIFALALSVAAQSTGPSASKYIGPGSCSASGCHGSVKPLAITHVLQDEYSTWVVQDPHAKAYRSLQNSVSRRMAQILKIQDPESSPKCLACHALYVPASAKGRDFDLSEGVSCESCHGPASAWLGPHTMAGGSMQKFVAMGMYDLSNLTLRSEKCLSCHLGTAEKQVDHAMIAAGHPDLVFELDSYSAIEPPHWKPSNDPNFGVRDWSVGQAVQLRESLKRLSRRAQSASWPDYSELDCFSCHHSLTTAENSWRRERGYPGRTPGAPPWNSSHYSIFRVLARELDPASNQRLDSAMEKVYQLTSQSNVPGSEISGAAESASAVANDFVRKANEASFDSALTQRMMTAIAADTGQLSQQDTRTAEQAAMAIDSFYISYSKQNGPRPAVRVAIDGLFKLLQNPSAYDAPRYRAQMKKVSTALKEAGIR